MDTEGNETQRRDFERKIYEDCDAEDEERLAHAMRDDLLPDKEAECRFTNARSAIA